MFHASLHDNEAILEDLVSFPDVPRPYFTRLRYQIWGCVLSRLFFQRITPKPLPCVFNNASEKGASLQKKVK